MHSATAISIRDARPGDVPLVVGMIRSLAEYERLSDQCFADEAALAGHLFGERRFAEVVIASCDGTPAGFALFFYNYSTFLTRPGIYLEDLFVLPEMRGLGVGRALLSHLAALAVARGCGRLEWAVLTWNEPAIGFYEKLGAVRMEDWRVYRLAGTSLEQVAQGLAPGQ